MNLESVKPMIKNIESLIALQINNGVIDKRDYVYVKNQLFNLLEIEPTEEKPNPKLIKYPSEVLEPILDCLEDKGLLGGSKVARDLFDAKIMNVFASLPSVVENKFNTLLKNNNSDATNYLYNYAKSLNYIREDRVANNIVFERASKYGNLVITINLSKPEKDPKSILLASKQKTSSYPKCVLCRENEGFAGDFTKDSRDQHRLIKFDLLGENWYFQYSPYTYYNEHAIVFSENHMPMQIERKTFERLLALTDYFNGYFFGSNADLPIVGGSILSHEHYQGGKYVFPIENVHAIKTFKYDNINVEILNWPLSAIRLRSNDKNLIVDYANKIFDAWNNYFNLELGIKAYTNNTKHHTITPIARKKANLYELDLLLRDNQTSDKYPLGIFHPHKDKWHIKKENIGLIEAIGLAVLPGRLKDEFEELKRYLLGEIDVNETISKHIAWANTFKSKVTKENIDELIEIEVTKVFEKILEDCGVFKLNEKGINAFIKFIEDTLK